MEEGKSLKDHLAEISSKLEALEEQKKIKTWQPPWSKRTIGKKKKRQGYVLFMNIAQNKSVTWIKAPVEEGVAMVNGVPHIIEPEDILLWKNKLPIVIQPQWSERPFSAKDHFAKTEESGMNTKGWEYIMNYIYKTQIKAKKAIGAGLIIIGVLVVGGLAWYLFKGGSGGATPVG